MFDPGDLQRMGVVFGQALYRRHLFASHTGQQGLARAHGLTIYVNGARTAQSHATTKFGAGHTKFVTDYPKQRCVRFGIGGHSLAVDLKFNTQIVVSPV